jgi:pilus assembly protein Flp/PilA
MSNFLAFVKNDDGQGLIEYSLVIALVSIVSVGALQFVGAHANNTLTNAANSLS